MISESCNDSNKKFCHCHQHGVLHEMAQREKCTLFMLSMATTDNVVTDWLETSNSGFWGVYDFWRKAN